MIFSHEFPVGVEWADHNKELSNKGFIEIFSNLATMHGISVGHTTDKGVSNVSWFVLNWRLEVLRRPVICETVIARTWGTTFSKTRANRDFDVLSKDGETLARATSVWVGLEGATGKFLRLTEENMAVFGPEPARQNFPGYEFPHLHRLELPVLETRETDVPRLMVDYNGHVHNSSYIDLANEVLPEEVYRAAWPRIEVTYKQEIHPEERVRLEYAEDGEKKYVFLRRAADGDFRAGVMLSGASE